MNQSQIRQFVMHYLEAEQCDVIEKHPAYVTVKLSPSADKELTYRPYYWNFVERTGITPETLTCTFIFDPDGYKSLQDGGGAAGAAVGAGSAAGVAGAAVLGGSAANAPTSGSAGGTPTSGGAPTGVAAPAAPGPLAPAPTAGAAGPTAPQQPWHNAVAAAAGAAGPAPTGPGPTGPGPTGAGPGGASASSLGTPQQAQPQQQPDSILGRYFGFVPTQVTARVPKDEVTFGSRRLQQIFGAVRNKGRFVHLYEQFQPEHRSAATVPYEHWLQVNYKVELACDMKRNEIHSLGFHLGTGEIREHFHELLQGKRLTPRVPVHVFIVPDKIALPRAVIYLEDYLEQKLRSYDHRWAEEAGLRLQDELNRILGYYETLIQNAEPDKKPEIEAQFLNRRLEIEWQYKPRIHISVINCGLFHVKMDSMPPTEVFR